MAKRAGINRDAVIRTAAKIADADGWDALTLARVAKKLRVRPPSLYNHVGGLEAGSEFAGTARTLERMGLSGMDAARIRHTVAEVFR